LLVGFIPLTILHLKLEATDIETQRVVREKLIRQRD
jgi:hypothetical protein